jgi:hypothetical protein
VGNVENLTPTYGADKIFLKKMEEKIIQPGTDESSFKIHRLNTGFLCGRLPEPSDGLDRFRASFRDQNDGTSLVTKRLS